jgi:hypothetical protein
MSTMTFAPYEVKADELGRADRVFKERGTTFKLAQHLETGQWAIWMMYTEKYDEEAFFAATRGMSVEESSDLLENFKLAKPVKMATKVDDDISPEYARENEGIFEIRCVSVLGY